MNISSEKGQHTCERFAVEGGEEGLEEEDIAAMIPHFGIDGCRSSFCYQQLRLSIRMETELGPDPQRTDADTVVTRRGRGSPYLSEALREREGFRWTECLSSLLSEP